MKHYILGTDEAGYGPNLGPLVIGCTVWEMEVYDFLQTTYVNDHLVELERRLAPITADSPTQLGKNDKAWIIGDSKKLYQKGKLHVLANSVLTALHLTGQLFSELQTYNLQTYNLEGIKAFADHVLKSLLQLRVSLCAVNVEMISPRDFNHLLGHLGNKSTLLSEATLSLIKNAIQALPDGGDVTVLCDKHGGRNYYADLLYKFFPDPGWIEILKEGTSQSVYRLGFQNRTIEFRFQTKADRHIPAALASMTAKLLRELAMLEFNRFWQQYLPDLRPTAGYPVDALRFFGQIEEISQKLGFPKNDIWREK